MTHDTYEDAQRDGILNAIRPLKPGVDAARVFELLTEAAEKAVRARREELEIVTRKQAHEELDRAIKVLRSFSPWTKKMVDHALASQDISFDDFARALKQAKSDPGYRLRSGRGKRANNLALERFIRECTDIWSELSTRALPRTVNAASPFCRFCDNATPDKVRTRDEAGVTGMVRRVLNPEQVRRRERFHVPGAKIPS